MTPDAALAQAFAASWPAAETRDIGGLRVGRGLGGGGRVSSAHAVGHWTEDDITGAEAVHAAWDQPCLFRAGDEDDRFVAALTRRGYRAFNPTAILQVPAAALTDRPAPPLIAFDIWPPLAIQRKIWNAGEVGPARQSVMERVLVPRTSILGRMRDRAAGAAFVAHTDSVAMIHAIEVVPAHRRQGLAGWMIRCAAAWAVEGGASRVALAVGRANTAAIETYRSLGFTECAGYGYYIRD